MKKNWTWLVATLPLAVLPLFAGCEQKKEPELGPAEQIGRKIDKAVQAAGKQRQEMEQKLGEELEQVGKAIQKSDRPHE